MTEKFEDPLQKLLQTRPYEVFLLPNLSYKSTEMRDIIENYLEMAAHPLPIYSASILLLRSTIDFRRHTVPDNLFADLRQETKSDDSLKEIFNKMQNALLAFEAFAKVKNLTQEEQLIYQYVLNYVKNSIAARMSSLNREDRLLPFWDQSALRKSIEKP